MKTDELIVLLAAQAPPVARHAAARRLLLALAAGLPLSVATLLVFYGVRPDLVPTMAQPMFWVKLLFPLLVAAGAFLTLQRLARPGAALRNAWLGMAVPLMALWALAAMSYAEAAPGERAAMVWGQTWRSCMFNILLLSLPVFAGTLAALRSLAPTQPAGTGFVAGLFAAATGAAVYALHCPELEAPFLAIWYVGGIAGTGVLGAALGRWLLRW